eukprot:gb/GEZN01007905.1/.p1 GENE.gb/GEZN01007905.1/~~gb/GEZN01007905.1/.p1  ORF type:complete len:422 (-),score=64.91 gb/GEZN01007905.1/:112-1377(-)
MASEAIEVGQRSPSRSDKEDAAPVSFTSFSKRGSRLGWIGVALMAGAVFATVFTVAFLAMENGKLLSNLAASSSASSALEGGKETEGSGRGKGNNGKEGYKGKDTKVQHAPAADDGDQKDDEDKQPYLRDKEPKDKQSKSTSTEAPTTSTKPMTTTTTTVTTAPAFPWTHANQAEWGKYFPLCNGFSQSPIVINTTLAISDADLNWKSLSFNYNTIPTQTADNSHDLMFIPMLAKSDMVSTLSGGPLYTPYQVLQYHFHWGLQNQLGSEHHIDDKVYPMEMHIVHARQDMLVEGGGNPVYAANGLAVFAVFFQIGAKNAALAKLLSQVNFNTGDTTVEDPFDLTSLLPSDAKSNYYTYQGSLTTPPCAQSVTWIVSPTPITVSQEQMDALRTLKSSLPAVGLIPPNYRLIQPLNHRAILKP